jgi:integrase
MATFKISIFDHQQREDGLYPISIRVTWKRQSAYIKTEYRVSKKQIRQVGKGYELKDAFLLRELNNRIADYEDIKLKKLGSKIEYYSAKELADYFVKQTKDTGGEIDMIQFGRDYASKLKFNYARIFAATLNAIVDFTGREKVMFADITSKFLMSFENHLMTSRKVIRNNQLGNAVEVIQAPVSDLTIRNYMSNIRTLFNAAIMQFNDDDKDEIVIKHYPFKKYKIKPLQETKKRNLSIDQIRAILNLPDEGLTERAIIARDVFLMSFMLVGTNTVDLFGMPASSIKNGRITYNREKTSDRRRDDAQISIRIEPEVEALIDKYRAKTVGKAFNFAERYANAPAFNANLNKGLKVVAEKLGFDFPLSTYYARHSWATIARNDCRISKDDVHMALNHVDDKTKITDIYIARDWSIIDDANRKVIDCINNKLS